MKNEKRTVFRFPFFYENEKQINVLKIQRKNLLNMKMVVVICILSSLLKEK